MKRNTDVDRWATMARWGVAVALYLGGCILAGMVLPDDNAGIAANIMFLLAVAVFWFLKLKARREQERRIDAAELRAGLGQ